MGAASIRVPRPCSLTPYAPAIKSTMAMPSQSALKLPAVRPLRMFKEAPPSLDEFTTSCTCADLVEVNTLTHSGITAPANVPRLMITLNFHQYVPSPRSPINSCEVKKVSAIETPDVIQTSQVRGDSKSTGPAANRAFWMSSLTK